MSRRGGYAVRERPAPPGRPFFLRYHAAPERGAPLGRRLAELHADHLNRARAACVRVLRGR